MFRPLHSPLLSFPPTRAAYARSHHNLNERHAERPSRRELSHSWMEMENCYRGKRLILASPSVSPVCARRQSHRIRMQPWEEEERSSVRCRGVDGCGGGETHCDCERGWMGVGVRAGNEQRPENAASFFRVSRGSWRTNERNEGYAAPCFGSMSSARLET